MGKESISYEELIQIVQLIESSSQFAELRFRVGDIEIELRAKNDGERGTAGADDAAAQAPVQGGEVSNAVVIAPAAKGTSAVAAQQFAPGTVLIRSPTVGTFYRAPEPGAPPFVEVGSRVTPQTTVCIIEVMKLMNSIPAEHSGVITHILVADARLVEAEQVLMVIDPNG